MATNGLTLSQPFENCVYQRNKDGIAVIPIEGTAPAGTEHVKAVFTAINGGQTKVQTLPVDRSGKFATALELMGGLYSLTIWNGAQNVTISRVGAGEVFAIFGHSFLQGGHDVSHQLPATDERVFTLLDTLFDPASIGRYKYGRLQTSVGPFHSAPDLWGQLGDRLAKRLNVPVLLYGCAYGGSNILQSYELLTGATRTGLPPGQTDPKTRQPFEPLELVMRDYASKTGIRGLLVEHGYNDRGATKQQFKDRFKYVIDYVRNTYQKPALAVVLVQEELTTESFTLADPTTGAAQKELIETYPNTYKGPDFNNPYWPPLHIQTQNDHMFGPSIDQFAKDWDESLTLDFFNKSTPYGPVNLPEDVFPLVLYNAPAAALKTVDWSLLGLAAVGLLFYAIYKSRYIMWGLLILGLLAFNRVKSQL